MEKTVEEYINICEWDPARFLIFSDNVFGNFIYYSHLLPLIISLILAFFIIVNDKKSSAAKLFAVTATLLSVWLFSDLVLWATEKPAYTMFFWSIVNMIEPMIYAGILLFLYSFIDKGGITFRNQIYIFFLLLPTVAFASTNLNLSYYDLTNCWREAIEGPLVYYGYFIEAIFVIWIVTLGMRRFYQARVISERKRVLFVTAGAVLFLLSFAMGNVLGSLLVDWEIGQYGLFGIPVFMASLSYIIVKYHAFNTRVVGAQVLITSLWIITSGILFLRDIDSVRIVVSVTLILLTLLGYSLMKSIKREVEQREKIEKLASQLQKANDRLRELDKQKSEFLSFASHQLRSPLTAIKGYASLILEGTFGPLSDTVKEAVAKVFQSTQGMVLMVEDFLNISRIEQGRMKYEMVDFDFGKLASEITEELKPMALKKNLELTFETTTEKSQVNGDPGKLRQVIANLIDNSIKYTPAGKVSVIVSSSDNKVRLTISDTGVGIPAEEIGHLFEKFARTKGAHEVNVSGTGLGLYLAKMIAGAHHGKVWAESEGEGKGSKFVVELPAK